MSRKTKESKNSSRTRRKPESNNSSRTRAKSRPAKKAAFAEDELVKNQRLAGRYAGVSTRTVRRWVQAGMPRTEKGHYIKAMLDFFKVNEGSEPTEAKKKKEEWSAKKTEHQAQILEMEIEDKRRDIDAELERALVRRVIMIKRAFMGLGRRLGPQVAKVRDLRKCQKMIDDEVKAIIQAFSE